MTGIIGYGTYVPHHRLDRAAITTALGSGGGRGTRAVASFDEDATSMAVEAGRALLRANPGADPTALLFTSATPPYLDKTNATTIHAALGLARDVAAFDFAGSPRSAAGALRAALGWPGSAAVLAADVSVGLPGGVDEASGGDAAAAVLCGDDSAVIADLIGTASASAEFLDRWRLPGEVASHHWEERFGELAYLPLATQAVDHACKEAGIAVDQADHVVLAGSHNRSLRRLAGSLGISDPGVFGTDVASTIGSTGSSALLLGLADALERAQPDEIILAVSLSDGADAFVFRTTELVTGAATETTVADRAADRGADLPYATWLTWRGVLPREPPRRPDPERPAAPPSFRRSEWKFGFVGSRCEACGTRHLPPQRICLECDATDQMVPEHLADVRGTIATYTVDRLAFSLNPPVVVAVIDFDGGGRFQCELTDVDPATVAIGDRVEMTFRRLFTADGVHNYFWKARPAVGGS